ncbi:hypothetical protein TWF730_005406 [Orbilia blumenaviensis]|uniref:Uncharacterized protein n=1 Tax=Orbilia blumenaviensis TaxID=1796055 RepID=A0AAV9VJP1_9PEZI
MPVKWTAENDHLLLITLLETHAVKIDGEKIKAAWPSNGGEVPTARAIRERIVKIRSLAGGGSPAKASVSSHVNNGVKKESSPKKRGRPRKNQTALEQDDEEIISKSNTNSPYQSFTTRDTTDITPSPTPRKNRTVKSKPEKRLKLELSESDVIELESSGDEFIPRKFEPEEEEEDDEYLGD